MEKRLYKKDKLLLVVLTKKFDKDILIIRRADANYIYYSL